MYTEVCLVRPTGSSIQDSVCHQHRRILAQWGAEELTWLIWEKKYNNRPWEQHNQVFEAMVMHSLH